MSAFRAGNSSLFRSSRQQQQRRQSRQQVGSLGAFTASFPASLSATLAPFFTLPTAGSQPASSAGSDQLPASQCAMHAFAVLP